MSVVYGGMNVDERYSSIVEPNLFYDDILADGKTFTSKYEIGPGGAICIHKLNTTGCAVGTPGRDFSDENSTDSLISVVFNNNYQKSKKIYGVQANAVGIELADEQLSLATQEVGEGILNGALACLIKEAQTTASSTASITSASLKKSVIADRKALKKAKANPNTILMSPDAFACLLEANGSEYTPIANEGINADAQVGKWLGMTVYECNALAESTGSYFDATSTKQTVTFSNVDYIMYNNNAFSLIPNLEAVRIVDSENFVGSKAQVEMNVAFRVTNGTQALVKTH